MNRIALFSALILLLLGTSISVHAIETLDTRYYGNRIIVKMKPIEDQKKNQPAELSPDKMAAMAEGKRYILRKLKRTALGSSVVQLSGTPNPEELETLVREINQRNDVEYAHVDYKRYPAAFSDGTPSDALFPLQWYLRSNQNNPGAANVTEAWKSFDGTDVIISVIDTGYARHSDFNLDSPERVLLGPDFISADGDGSFSTAGDGDGVDEDGSDIGDMVTQNEKDTNPVFTDDPGCTPSDSSSWHGAQVAGIINARVDNGVIAGMAPGSSIIMARALGKCGGYISDIMDAALWSAGLPVPSAPTNLPILASQGSSRADIINLSLGGGGDCTPTEGEAIWEIVSERNVVVVTAAGNEGGDANASSPGNCTGTINVAANTRLGGEANYTNFGSFVDLSAPGGNDIDPSCDTNGDGVFDPNTDGKSPANDPECFTGIVTTTFNIDSLAAEGDSTWIGRDITDSAINTGAQGTSFSAPIVTGVIALMLDADQTLTPSEVYSILIDTVQPFPTGASDAPRDCQVGFCGAGIIDGEAATSAAASGNFTSLDFPIKSNTPEGPASGGSNSAPFFGATGKGGGGGVIAPLISLALVLLVGWRRTRH